MRPSARRRAFPPLRAQAWARLLLVHAASPEIHAPTLPRSHAPARPRSHARGRPLLPLLPRVCVSNYIGDPDTGGSGFGGVALEVKEDPGMVKTNSAAMAAAIETALLDLEKIAAFGPQASKL